MDHEKIIDELRAHRLDVQWVYPGMAWINVTPDYAITTGLGGWEYGTGNVLVDGGWQPDEQTAHEPAGINERTTDTAHIAFAWAVHVFIQKILRTARASG